MRSGAANALTAPHIRVSQARLGHYPHDAPGNAPKPRRVHRGGLFRTQAPTPNQLNREEDTMSLFAFNRATERVEQIADELRGIARQTPSPGDTEREARRRLAHLLFGNSQDAQLVAAEMRKIAQEEEDVLERRAIGLVQELPEAERVLATTFDEQRPKRDVGSATAVMLSQERWAATKTLLDSGRSIDEAISIADLETVYAIEAFAVDYLFAQARRDTGDRNAIKKAVDIKVRARLTEIATPAVADILAKAHRAQGFADIAWEYAKHLNARFSGAPTSAMATGVAVSYIRRDYGIDKTPQQERSERNVQASTEESRKFKLVSRWAQRANERTAARA